MYPLSSIVLANVTIKIGTIPKPTPVKAGGHTRLNIPVNLSRGGDSNCVVNLITIQYAPVMTTVTIPIVMKSTANTSVLKANFTIRSIQFRGKYSKVTEYPVFSESL